MHLASGAGRTLGRRRGASAAEEAEPGGDEAEGIGAAPSSAPAGATPSSPPRRSGGPRPPHLRRPPGRSALARRPRSTRSRRSVAAARSLRPDRVDLARRPRSTRPHRPTTSAARPLRPVRVDRWRRRRPGFTPPPAKSPYGGGQAPPPAAAPLRPWLGCPTARDGLLLDRGAEDRRERRSACAAECSHIGSNVVSSPPRDSSTSAPPTTVASPFVSLRSAPPPLRFSLGQAAGPGARSGRALRPLSGDRIAALEDARGLSLAFGRAAPRSRSGVDHMSSSLVLARIHVHGMQVFFFM